MGVHAGSCGIAYKKSEKYSHFYKMCVCFVYTFEMALWNTSQFQQAESVCTQICNGHVLVNTE